MKSFGCLIVTVCSLLIAKGQKYDNTWLWGILPQNQNDTLYPYHGNAYGSFTNNTFISDSKFRGMTFSEMNNSISDPTTGDLLFYSNGLCVRDSNSQIIQNGDSMGFGMFWHSEDGGFGGRAPWDIITLPTPQRDSMYKIIYYRIDDWNAVASMCYSDLCLSESSMKLITKDVKFTSINPELGGLAACKHGNGRDWWVIFIEANTNCFHKFLLTPDTFEFHSIQCIGRIVDSNDECKNVFSPDGTKLLRAPYYGASDVFDFDRCTGMLSNFLPLDTFNVVDTSSGVLWDAVTSGEFSSNNRFLYLNSGYFVLQYDLTAPDVNHSRDTVGVTDYLIDTVPQNTGPYVFYLSQTAPDGRIFIGPGAGQRFFSTIENPNGKGDSCQFKLRNVVVPKWIELTIPYYPNYRLGHLPGSPCDTLSVLTEQKRIEKEKLLKLFPNPTTTSLTIDYGFTDWSKGEVSLDITTETGQLVYTQTLPMYSGFQKINISGFPAGIYHTFMKRNNAVVAAGKFAKE